MKKSNPVLSGPLKRGMILLFLFSFAGIGVLVIAAGGSESLTAFNSLRPSYIVFGLVLAAFDLFLGGFRNHIFIKRIKPGTSYRLSFRANAANMFMGAITPSQGLGGPAQLAVLNLGGIPLGAAVSVSVLNFIGTILFFGAGVAAALLVFQKWILSETVRSILWGCAGRFLVAVFTLGAALFKPSIIKRISRGLCRILIHVPRINRGRLKKWSDFIERKIDEYHGWCLEFLLKKPGVVLLSIFITILLYLNKFTISWFIIRGLGMEIGWGAVFSSLYLITFISYFAPSPGASGIAEVSTGLLLSPLINGNLLPLFTLLNRMFILFIPAGVGFLTFMGTMHRRTGSLMQMYEKSFVNRTGDGNDN